MVSRWEVGVVSHWEVGVVSHWEVASGRAIATLQHSQHKVWLHCIQSYIPPQIVVHIWCIVQGHVVIIKK